MIRKKCVKFIMLFIIILVIIGSLTNTIYAYNIQDELGTTNLSAYAQVQNGGSSPKFDAKVSTILGALSMAGSIISVGSLVGIGMKYMSGSVEEKAEYKKSLKPYIIGALMIFGIPNLLSVVYQIFSNIF